MAIAPNSEEQLAVEIRRIYEDAQFRLMSMVANRLVSGPGDIAEWQAAKLAELGQLLRDTRKVSNALNKQIPNEISKIIELAHIAGNQSAVDDLTAVLEAINAGDEEMTEQIQMALFPDKVPDKIAIDATISSMAGINTVAIEALAGATTGVLMDRHTILVRAVDDVYRKIVTEVVGSALTGVETRREVTQRIVDKFLGSGITIFKTEPDKNGRVRHWDIASYSEMATRSAIGQASLEGHMAQQTKFGFDLVQISDHHEECDLCRPWEGKVLSVEGKTPGKKTLAEAIKAGLFHPNCGHRGNTYFEGITKPLTKTADPAGYEERKKQRYIERQIRAWKKRQAVAVTDRAKQQTAAKVAEWEETMADFISETGRRRKKEREQTKKAR